MNKESKPREWLIASHYSTDHDKYVWHVVDKLRNSYSGISPDNVKVVELSAFQAERDKVRKLVEELHKANGALKNVEGLSRRFPEFRGLMGFHPFETVLKEIEEA